MSAGLMPSDYQIAIQHYNSCKSIIKDSMRTPESLDRVCGVWFYGSAGAGKSFRARQDYPDAYLKMANKWWDGYQLQENVIIDDLDVNHACLGHHLKIWADRYAFVAEVKGYAIAIRPKTIVVTSQYSIEEIWPDEKTREALTRRFKQVRIGLPDDAPAALQRMVLPTQVVDLTQEDDTDEDIPSSVVPRAHSARSADYRTQPSSNEKTPSPRLARVRLRRSQNVVRGGTSNPPPILKRGRIVPSDFSESDEDEM